MSKILNSNAKFKLRQFDYDKELNYILNFEKKNFQCFRRSKKTKKRLQKLITHKLILAYCMVWLRYQGQ